MVYRVPGASQAALSYSRRIGRLVEAALLYVDPRIYAARVELLGILAAVAALLFSATHLPPIYMPFFAVGFYGLVKLLGIAYLIFKVKMRVKRVEDELPLMAMYMSAVGSLGVNLSDMLRGLLDSREMPGISKEVKKVFRDSRLFFGDVISSLDWNAKRHPSQSWSRYFMGLISILHSGGNLTKYFEEKTRELLSELKSRWSIYSERASDWGEMIIGVFLLAVALVLISAFITPTDATAVLSVLAFPVIPLITVTMLVVMEVLAPPSRDHVEFRPILPLLAAMATAALLAYLEVEPWVLLAAASTVFSLYNGYMVWRQIREVVEEERWIPHFLRSLIDARKVGIPLDHAIARMRGFGKRIDEILDLVSTQLKMGIPMNKVKPGFRSWLAKTAFFVVGNLAVYGGGTSEILERVYAFIVDVQEAKNMARRRMRLYAILASIAPIIISAMLSVTLGLANLYMRALTLNTDLLGLPVGLSGLNYRGLMSFARLIVVESGIAMGLTVAKARSLTVKDTRLVALIILMSISSFVVFSYIKPETLLGIAP